MQNVFTNEVKKNMSVSTFWFTEKIQTAQVIVLEKKERDVKIMLI